MVRLILIKRPLVVTPHVVRLCRLAKMVLEMPAPVT